MPRPTLVTWLGIGVLTLAALQLVRFLASLRLPDLEYVVPIWYFGVRNGMWFFLLTAIGLGLLTGRRWSLWGSRLGMLLYFGWYWLDRLLLVQSSYVRETAPLSAFISIAGMILFIWLLSRPQVIFYFQE